jgi:hypothetical protein
VSIRDWSISWREVFAGGQHQHDFRPLRPNGGPASFGVRYDRDGTQHPFVAERCKCGERRHRDVGSITLPHATIIDGEKVMRPGYMDRSEHP